MLHQVFAYLVYGDGQSQLALAGLYLNGGHGLERDIDMGIKWLSKARFSDNEQIRKLANETWEECKEVLGGKWD